MGDAKGLAVRPVYVALVTLLLMGLAAWAWAAPVKAPVDSGEASDTVQETAGTTGAADPGADYYDLLMELEMYDYVPEEKCPTKGKAGKVAPGLLAL